MSQKYVSRKSTTRSAAGVYLLFPVLLVLLSAIFSLYGVLETFRKFGLPPNLYDALWQAWNIVRDSPVVFISGQEASPHWSVAAGGLLAKVVPCAAFVSGAWVAWGFFRDYLRERWWNFFPKPHSVYIGFGQSATYIAFAELDKNPGQRVAAVDVDDHNSHAGILRENGGLFLSGSGTDPLILRRAGIGHARTIWILTESDDVNSKVAQAVFAERNHCCAGKTGRQSHPATIIVSIESHEYRQLLRDHWKLTQKDSNQKANQSLRLTGFRYAAIQDVLIRIGMTQGVRDDVRSQGLKVLVAGGNAFVEEFLRLAVAFLQLSGSSYEARPEFVVCTNGNDLGGEFLRRFPSVELVASVAFIEDEPKDVAWAPTLERRAFHVAVVSLPTEAETLWVSKRLTHTSRLEVPKVYAMVASASEIDLTDLERKVETISITEEGAKYFSRIFSNAALDSNAQKLHEAYHNHETQMGRDAQSWEQIPELLKESNRWLYLHGTIGKAIRDTLQNATQEEQLALTNHLVRCEHQRWMGERIMDGWVYGPVKNAGKRTHNLIKPFDELSQDDQDKVAVQVRVNISITG